MRKNLGFRAWFYFRQGWSTYFAFILAAINTMVVTYYLAIEKAPALKEIFPTFTSYLLLVAAIGIPLLVIVGYVHYKKVSAYSSELDIMVESNPYMFKSPPGWYIEVQFPLWLAVIKAISKWAKDEKLSNEEMNQLSELQKKIEILIKGGLIGKMPTK